VADPAGLPLLALALTVYGLMVMPAGNAWSRWRERLADRYALEATANPTAFASAMTRLADQNLADAQPPAWVEFLLHSHPSISKRVAMAEQYRE
jgi:STE24 endopeptidase